MSRRTVLAVVTGSLLIGSLSAPALANPVTKDDDGTTVCVRTDSTSGTRDGLCVWLPNGLPIKP